MKLLDFNHFNSSAMMNYHKRNLPHIQPVGATYSITFLLDGALPLQKVASLNELRKRLKDSAVSANDKYQIHRKIFDKYESILDNPKSGPVWLKERNIAEIVMDSIHHRDGLHYNLYAYCIMSNHVHLVFEHIPDPNKKPSNHPISDILRDLKKYTARKINILINRSGTFWHVESYDRVIRNDGELENQIAYVIHNPVKAGLVSDWKKWPYTYCKEEFKETFR
ncbi:MAG: transposase [Balneolaceae bacterium]